MGFSLKHVSRSLLRTAYNFLVFKEIVPLYGELIWVDPKKCVTFLDDSYFKEYFGLRLRQASGLVVNTWPERYVRSIKEHPKVVYCLSHWIGGKTWREAGAVDFMLENIALSPSGCVDDCQNELEVLERFFALDKVWLAVQNKGRLLTRKEIFPNNFREIGGILIHLGPGGVPIFSGAGCHRFAMALALGKPFPAQLGCVHISALDSLAKYRKYD